MTLDDKGEQQSGWGEDNSAFFIATGKVFTPGREEMAKVFLDLIPAAPTETFTAVDIGAGAGWLSRAVLERFPAAHVIALDGSPAMLDHARNDLAPFAGRADFRRFALEDEGWIDALAAPIRLFMSSLVIHHLDGPGKKALYRRLHERLEPGGALLIADIVAPASERERRYLARAWDEETRHRSLQETGDLRAYKQFVASEWNWFTYPDPFDKPSGLVEQLRWLEEVGFSGVDAFWVKAGHAIFGGYKPASG